MRVIRSSGQNVSPSDDGRLYQQAFKDGLFEPTTINSLGGNLVSIGAMYGIMQGRDFTVEAQNINVELPSDGNATGYIYVQFDTTTADVITVESALAPFTPTYDDINTNGTICQMVIATYQASAVAVTSIASVYDTATTKTDPTLVGSVAMIETSPATSSHAVGTYLFYNGQLYEVIASIAVGETLVVGSNIVATSIGNEIADLKPTRIDTAINGLHQTTSFAYTGKSFTIPPNTRYNLYFRLIWSAGEPYEIGLSTTDASTSAGFMKARAESASGVVLSGINASSSSEEVYIFGRYQYENYTGTCRVTGEMIQDS